MCNTCNQNISSFAGADDDNSAIGLKPIVKPLFIGANGDDDDLEEDLGIDLNDKKSSTNTADTVGSWIKNLGPLADIWNKVRGRGPIDLNSSSTGSSSTEDDVESDNSWIYWTVGGVVVLSLGIWAFVKFGNN